MSEKPKFVYVTYIAAPPEKVWEALTKPDISEKYWFGYRVAADGKLGDLMTATSSGRQALAPRSHHRKRSAAAARLRLGAAPRRPPRRKTLSCDL